MQSCTSCVMLLDSKGVPVDSALILISLYMKKWLSKHSLSEVEPRADECYSHLKKKGKENLKMIPALTKWARCVMVKTTSGTPILTASQAISRYIDMTLPFMCKEEVRKLWENYYFYLMLGNTFSETFHSDLSVMQTWVACVKILIEDKNKTVDSALESLSNYIHKNLANHEFDHRQTAVEFIETGLVLFIYPLLEQPDLIVSRYANKNVTIGVQEILQLYFQPTFIRPIYVKNTDIGRKRTLSLFNHQLNFCKYRSTESKIDFIMNLGFEYEKELSQVDVN